MSPPPTVRHIHRPRHDVTQQDVASVTEFVKRRLLYTDCAFVFNSNDSYKKARAETADETRTTGYHTDPHSFALLERTHNSKCLQKHVTQ